MLTGYAAIENLRVVLARDVVSQKNACTAPQSKSEEMLSTTDLMLELKMLARESIVLRKSSRN